MEILVKNQSRLQTLRNRREKLIELSIKFGYTQSGNLKIQKYYDCILYVRRQINNEECKNVHPLKSRSPKVFQGFLNVQNGGTIKDVLNLKSSQICS